MEQVPPVEDCIVGLKDAARNLSKRELWELRRLVEQTEEQRMEMAEGDLLSRRRRCDEILNEQPQKRYYGSLTVQRTPTGRLVVEDVDGVECEVINPNELPAEDPHRIEALQERLDRISFRELAKL